MVRELEVRAHGGAEEHSGRARANPANELNRRFLRGMNVLLSAAALSGPAAVAGLAAGTAVVTQAREAKAQLEGIQSVSLDEMQDAIRRGRALSAGQETYMRGEYSIGATVVAQGHRIEIGIISDPSHPEADRDGFGITVTRPDGTVDSRDYTMARLRDLYRQATGDDFLFVTIGIDFQDTPDGYVEAYIIPLASRGGEVQSGVPFNVVGYDLNAGRFTNPARYQTQ